MAAAKNSELATRKMRAENKRSDRVACSWGLMKTFLWLSISRGSDTRPPKQNHVLMEYLNHPAISAKTTRAAKPTCGHVIRSISESERTQATFGYQIREFNR